MVKTLFKISAILVSVVSLLAQTTINGGRTINGPFDASGATSTQPIKKGTSTPGTCTQGEVYFKTDATAGQNLYYCTATNTWTQQLSSGGAAYDPFDRAVFVAVDDFATGSTTSGSIGQLGWQAVAVGAGSIVNQSANSAIENPYTVRFLAGEVSAVAGISMGGYQAAGRNILSFPTKVFKFEFIFKVTDSLTGANLRVGASDDPGTPHGVGGRNAFGVRYLSGTDSIMVAYTNVDGTETAVCNGSAAPTLNTWYRVTISGSGTSTASVSMKNAAGTDLFTTCTLTMPTTTAGYSPFAVLGSSDTTVKNAYVDWFALKVEGLTR